MNNQEVPRQKRIGLIGSGRTGIEHARALRASGAVLAWIAVRSQQGVERTRALELTENVVIWNTTSLFELPSCDGIVICVPILETASVLESALEVGVPILVEKPVALSADQLRILSEKALQKYVRVFVAFNRRNYEWVREFRKRDKSALNIRAFLTEDPERFSNAGHPEEVIKNLVLANSSHLWDLVFFLAAEVDHRDTQVIASIKNGRLIYSLQGRGRNGCIWSIQSIDKSNARWRVECETADDTWISSPVEQAEIRKPGAEAETIAEPKDYKAGFLRQAEEFVSVLHEPMSEVALATLPDLISLADKIETLMSLARTASPLQRNKLWQDPSLLARCQQIKIGLTGSSNPELRVDIKNEAAGNFLVNDVHAINSKIVLHVQNGQLQLNIDNVQIGAEKINAATGAALSKVNKIFVSFYSGNVRIGPGKLVATINYEENKSSDSVQASDNITVLEKTPCSAGVQDIAKNYRFAFRRSSLAKENARKRATREYSEMDCHRQIREYLERKGSWRDKSLLDVGCGPGHFFHSVKSLGFRYTGLDYSEELIAIGKEFIGSQADEEFQLQHRELETLRDDEVYDVVVATNVLYWQPSWQYPIEMLARSAKEAFIIREPLGPKFKQRWMPDVLLDEGFQDLNCYFNILPEPQIKGMLNKLGFEVSIVSDERSVKRFDGEPERVGGVDFPYGIIIAERRSVVRK